MKPVRMVAAGLACLALCGTAPAKMVAPQPVPVRAATADLVVVGKVTGFGPKLVPAERFKGDTAEFQIATVEVSETLVGKGVKEVQVAFVPPPAPVPPGPGPGGVRPFIRRRPGPTLSLGQEACLFLHKHPTKDFYTLENYSDIINKKDNPAFATDTDEVKKAARLLANPKAGLASKDRDEKFLTAALLLTRYNTPRPYAPAPAKKEAIPADESKAILLAVAGADWDAKPVRAFALTPQNVFYRIGATPADGWTQPKDFKEFPKAAQKWLTDNADKFQIQRFVAAHAEAGK